MASRKLEDLTDDVAANARRIVEVLDEVGVDLLIYCTLRPLEEQARLYRQSRPWSKIKNKILDFQNRGYGYLAEILEEVGPCSGPHVTNATCGESWHNYAEAFDAVPLIGGKAAWNYFDHQAEWDAYGESVRQVGMIWAGDWTSFREYPHAQKRPGGNPLREFDPDKVHDLLVTNKLLTA